MNKTNVPYATHTLPAVRGCSKVSPGCESCYACRLAAIWPVLRDSDAYKGLAEVGPTGKPRWKDVRLCPEELQKPLRRRKPAVVFVADMGDLFHEKVPFEYIAAVFGVMAATPHITYLLLTKRAKRMREWYHWASFMRGVDTHTGEAEERPVNPLACCSMKATGYGVKFGPRRIGTDHPAPSWPLPNVWPGVSVESQDYVHRIEELLKVPAVGRWVSYEPGLGPLDLEAVFSVYDSHGEPSGPRCKSDGSPALSLVVAGCESGPGRRPFELDWARSLRDQCAEAGVCFYLKQIPSPGSVFTEPFLDGRRHLELPW